MTASTSSQGESEARDELLRRLPLIQAIADAAEPGGPYGFSFGSMGSVTPIRDGALRLEGVLQSQAEKEAILGPVGPVAHARGLHPWVWGPAANLWDGGHRREAIQAAANQIELQLQAKMGMHDASGADLVRQAFSLSDPEPGKPRLRFAGFRKGTRNWRSAHQGAGDFGAGCMMRIRNIAAHVPEQPPEQEALEELAALSVLARWIDCAQVKRGRR